MSATCSYLFVSLCTRRKRAKINCVICSLLFILYTYTTYIRFINQLVVLSASFDNVPRFISLVRGGFFRNQEKCVLVGILSSVE